MRLGVLDIGSNTGHLLVVDAHGGAAPLPASSHKQPLRLAEHLDADGAVTKKGIEALTDFCAEATRIADDKGCEEMLGFATSAVRDCGQLRRGPRPRRDETGVALEVLSGEDEARLTFLAVRRWFGWSAGRLAVFDIGGGSLEIAGGDRRGSGRGLVAAARRRPDGAPWFGGGRPSDDDIRELRKQIRAEIARDAGHLLRPGVPDRAAATSKTFRSLARICGAAPSGDGPLVPRVLELETLSTWIPKLMELSRRRARRRCPASRPVAPTRSCRVRWSPRRAWTSSTSPSSRSARGRCARA